MTSHIWTSLGSSRPRLGASKEQLEQCPYESYHWIRSVKLHDHVVKCRLNYQENLRKKGERSFLLSCQYNHNHKVFDTEWNFHMARCPDRQRIWSYQLRAGPLKQQFPSMLTLTAEDLPKDENELADMYGGLNAGHIVGPATFGKLVKLEDVGKDAKQKAQDEAAEKGRALAKEVEAEWRQQPPPEFETRYSQDEIDYWNGPGRNVGNSFNWMDHISQPRGYNIITFPPGLTKAQRREFERKNAEEFEKRIAKAEEKKKAEGIVLLEKLLVEEAEGDVDADMCTG